MSWRRFSTSAVVSLSLAIAAPAFAEAPRAAAETVVENGPFQTQFPGAGGGAGGGTSSFGSGGGSSGPQGGAGGQNPQGGSAPANGPRKLGGGGGRRLSPGGGPGLSLPGVGAFGTMLGYLMIAVLVIVVLGLIVWIIVSRTPAPDLEAEVRPAPPPDGRSPRRAALGDLRSQAERLAMEGKYDEAIHLLLLAAILHLSNGGAPPESRTSRELLSHFRLDLNSKEAFSALVLAVERSLFGGQALGAAEWRECAGRHDALVRGAA